MYSRRFSNFGFLILLILIVLLPHLAQSTTSPEQIAEKFVELLATKNYDGAYQMMDSTMKAVMPTEKLKSTWENITNMFGDFKYQTKAEQTKYAQFDIIIITGHFEKGKLNIKVVLNPDGEVSGLWFMPYQPKKAYDTPAYVDTTLFEEVECTVKTGDWKLPATLTLPKKEGKFPAVVLIQGSGPNDRDETVGALKPFRDIAQGLASKGIVVLRYEKRTKQYPERCAKMMDSLGLDEEVIDDAISAIELLGWAKKVDPKRIFVLGHSLGAVVAPVIAQRETLVAGIIMVCASPRKITELMLDQYKYIYTLDGKLDKDEKKRLKELKKKIKKITKGKIKPGEIVLGAGKKYWDDILSLDPIKELKKVKVPVLIVGCGRDYQVPEKDFRTFEEKLSGMENITFKFYPKLNHLLVEGEGMSTPTEYQKPGHVSEKFINDIAEWVKGH